MTAKQERHKRTVASMGCLICGAPAELHHPRFCVGMSQRASDYLVVPLCPGHHRHGGFGQCIHNGKRAFESNYMSEQNMLAEVISRITR